MLSSLFCLELQWEGVGQFSFHLNGTSTLGVILLVVGTNVVDLHIISCLLVLQVIAAYLFGDKPQLEKAMQILQGVRASNFMVAYKTLAALMKACWMANKVEDADLLFQDMISANYNIDAKV